jgi:pimeloyl-ACP methyl ester carboxylesterase
MCPCRRSWLVLLLVALAWLHWGCATAARQGAGGPAPAFVVRVEGHGPPMVLIPGYASSGAVWDGVVAHYRERYTCHVLTLAGFAGVPAAEAPLLPQVERQLLAYLDAHQLERPVLVGHSLGGVLALQLAAQAPERFSQVVVVDSLPFYAGANDPAATAQSVEPLARDLRAQLRDGSAYERRAYEEHALPALISDPARVQVALDWVMRSDPETLGQAFYEFLTTDLRPELSRIRAPVLVVGSSPPAHRQGTEETFRSQYATLAGARLVIDEHSRHFIMWDDLPRLLAEMDGFLPGAAPLAQGPGRP